MQANANQATYLLASATLDATLKGGQLAECRGHRKMLNIFSCGETHQHFYSSIV
jgi:hypothetical protein